MPVPNAITDLSTIAASNSPAGTEPVITADDYLRTHASFLRQLYDLLKAASGALSVGQTIATDIGIGVSPSTYGGKLAVYAGDVVMADSGTISAVSAPRISSSGQSLVVKTNNGAGAAAGVLWVDGNGSLGIGTAVPATPLHVSSPTGEVRFQNTTSGSAFASFRDSTTSSIPWIGGAGDDLKAVTNTNERIRIKGTGQVRLVPLASDPAGAQAGDMYFNSTTNKHRGYNGTTWNDFY